MSMRVWQIDPKLSAMQNLWSAVHVAVYYLCGQYGKRVKMFEEEWDEFKQTVMYNSVLAFLKTKIGPGNSYSHKHSFYQNVYSVVWSRFYRDLIAFQNKWIKPKMNSINRILRQSIIDGKDPDCVEFAITPLPRYVREGERSLARQDLESWLRGPTCTNGRKFREQELADEIEEARLELFGENYKPTDWAALRAKRDSLREERLKNENTDSDSCEGKTEGVHPDGRVLPGKRRRRGTKPVPKIKHRA